VSVPSEPVYHARDPRSVHSSLPAVYATDPTAQAFATAIDAMLIPVDRTLERLPDNFDAFEAPADLLPYLVRVSQARVEPSWPERAVRAAIDLAAWLAVHRGTPAALFREASVVYGWTLMVADPGGVRLPDDALTWPTDGTLYVDLEPELSGWDPVAYNQGSLERLIAAHVPASSPRILAPPPGKCALYEGPYSTGRALLVSQDVADLATSGFNNTASSVWNRSKGILALYEDPDFGESGGRQIVPAQQAVNVMESMNKRTSSVKFLTTVPTGSWGLLDGDGNLLGVYDGDMSDLEAGVGAAAASLVNNTIHTLGASGAQPDASQVIYPGITVALDPGLARELSRVVVYTQVPDGAFCLYQLAQQGGKQWVLWTQPGESVSLAAIGADNVVSSVYNRTAVTLELWANSDSTGASQFFYPSAFADVTAAGLTGQASLVTVLNGAPTGYYCLYAGLAKTGKQWVFKELNGITINLTDPRVAAGDAVLSVENLTSGTLELFRNDNGTGASQLFYPGLTVDVTTAGLADLARSVAAYGGPPAGYYCLYANADKTGNRWVFPGTVATVQLTSATIGAGNAASLVGNNTTRTLALFKNDNGTGDSQFFYPESTSAVIVSGLDKMTQSATVYDGPPNEHYCLYGGSPAKQWVFKAATNTDNDLTASGAASTVTQVYNRTTYTIELFAETNGTGAYQLFYPQTNVSVRSDFWDRAKLARCYNGPPADYFCLYEGTNQTGTQWVFRDAPGTWWDATAAGQNWNDKISSVYNRTRHTLELFEHTNQGGKSELFYPGQNAKANVTTINNMASSVASYNGPPNGYYCLYEGTNQSGNQYVLRSTIGSTNLAPVGASDKISSVRNMTDYTIQLVASGDQVWQLFYPSQNANVQSNLDNKTVRVAVLDGPPGGYYCLYEHGTTSGRQWVFHESNSEVNLTRSGIGAEGISNVKNNTRYTLELWSEANATGQSQMFYPGLTTAAESSFNDKAKYASLHTYWHDRYFYLCEFPSYGGLQWAFKEGTKAKLADMNAANRVSSIGNATWKPLTLYSNDNWTGTTYWLPRGGGGSLVAPSLPSNIDNLSKSVWNTD
jgi:hypothetical protein